MRPMALFTVWGMCYRKILRKPEVDRFSIKFQRERKKIVHFCVVASRIAKIWRCLSAQWIQNRDSFTNKVFIRLGPE